MDDSKRLRREVERRAAADAARAGTRSPVAVGSQATDMVLDLARRHVKDPTKIRPATDDEMNAAEQRLRQERLERQAEILLRRLPGQYRRADIPDTEFGAQARAWLNDFRAARRAGNPGHSLTILGPTGTGKTWTACALARLLLIEDTLPVTVTTTAEMLESMRPATGGLEVDMAQYALAPMLVLDDLGSEKLTEWAEEQLYRLAHERSHNGRPTIITSNLSGAKIRERYNERLVERLFGGSALIILPGESRRALPF